MKTYEEIVRDYQKRQHDTMVDTLSTALTYVDEIAVDTGILEETGLMTELTGAITGALPFVIIAAAEGTKVILGRKPMKTGAKDGAFRMVKTGAALGLGAAVATAAGFIPAIPVTMGVRLLFDRYKLKALTGRRVQNRIERLQELRRQLENPQETAPDSLPEATLTLDELSVPAAGYIE
ncbi:MAG: hypothetical protein IKS31_01630 [Clostridia bacterium]|nr:hypothetical protein [Clostridia bacterium]